MKKFYVFSMAVLYSANAISRISYYSFIRSKQWLLLIPFVFGALQINALSISDNADKPVDVKSFATHKHWCFMENKGQLNATDNVPLKEIKYYGMDHGFGIYCKPGILSFVFSKSENDPDQVSEATGNATVFEPSKFKKAKPNHTLTSRMDLVFLGANPDAEIIPEEQQPYFENYYKSGAKEDDYHDIRAYRALMYKNIYSKIDLRLHVSEHRLEYVFIVHPGGNVNDIKLRWRGADKMEKISNKGFKYSNAIGYMEEQSLKCFVGKNRVASHFKQNDNYYGFEVGSWDGTKDLVIDPDLTWATYQGGSGNDVAMGISQYSGGYVYISGYTNSNTAMGTSGVYQSTFSGTTDAFLAKYSTSGKLIWSTYFGGNNTDQANAVCIDNKGSVYIAGYSASTGLATGGANQTSNFGLNDAFIAKFSKAGALIWATYFGGKGTDEANGISVDGPGNIYVTGYTESNSGIATAGTYQTVFAGAEDVFLAKYNSAGTELWATYFGGTGTENSQAICTDISGNSYIAGFTTGSSNLASTGAHQTVNGGNFDAFIAKFNSSGGMDWSTYYGGSNYDNAHSISQDASGFIYVAGETASFDSIATPGAYLTVNAQVPNSPLTLGYDAFLAKFSTSGSLQWATYYGGIFGDQGFAVCNDNIGNVYLAGYTECIADIATSGAYQTTNRGGGITRPDYGGDAFLVKFSNSGQRFWATYYGGTEYDQANGLSADSSGNVFMAGYTSSNTYITEGTPNQLVYGGFKDVFLTKFRFSLYPDDAGIDTVKSPADSMCAGSVPVKVHLVNYGNNTLTSTVINWSINGKLQAVFHWSGKLIPGDTTSVLIGNASFVYGNSVIKAWTSVPNGLVDSVSINDSATKIVNVLDLPYADPGGPSNICFGNSVTLGGILIKGDKYAWTSNPAGFVSSQANPTVSPKITTVYRLTELIPATGCKKTDSVKITVDPIPVAKWNVNASQVNCIFTVIDSSLPKTDYAWNFGDGSGSGTGYIINHVFPVNKSYLVKLKVTNADGCMGEYDSTLNISVSGLPDPGQEGQPFSMYPNPFRYNLYVSYHLEKKSSVALMLYNMSGKKVAETSPETQMKGNVQVEWDLQKYNLQPGMYLLKLMTDDQLITSKIVKF